MNELRANRASCESSKSRYKRSSAVGKCPSSRKGPGLLRSALDTQYTPLSCICWPGVSRSGEVVGSPLIATYWLEFGTWLVVGMEGLVLAILLGANKMDSGKF